MKRNNEHSNSVFVTIQVFLLRLMCNLTYTICQILYRNTSQSNNEYVITLNLTLQCTGTSFGDKWYNSHLRMSHYISRAQRSITDELASAKNIIFTVRRRSYVSNHVISRSTEIYDESDLLKAFYIIISSKTPGTTRI